MLCCTYQESKAIQFLLWSYWKVFATIFVWKQTVNKETTNTLSPILNPLHSSVSLYLSLQKKKKKSHWEDFKHVQCLEIWERVEK